MSTPDPPDSLPARVMALSREERAFVLFWLAYDADSSGGQALAALDRSRARRG